MGSKFSQQKPKQLYVQSDCITQSGPSSLHPISIKSLKQWHSDPSSETVVTDELAYQYLCEN